MFKIPLFGLSSVFYTSCTKKEPYLFIGKTHKFKNLLNLMTLHETQLSFISAVEDTNAEMERIKKEDENDMVETENRIFQNNEDSQNDEQ